MKIINLSLLATAAILSATTYASTKGIDGVYGEDNRLDVFEVRDSAQVELSRSTAAMISPSNLKILADETIEISGKTLEARGVCSTERFAKQMSAANCSGFLVAPNVLVTAGHCIRTQADCDSYKWIFDFKVDHSEQGKVNVPTSSVYSCSRIIDRSLNNFTKDDYAVLELDRSVDDRRPLNFRRKGKISEGDKLVMIGHPTGIATKIAAGSEVRSLKGKYFVANLDAFGGNSGSAVFNADTHEIEGILVRGDTDYVYNSENKCNVVNVCEDEGCRGEDVTYITNISALKKIR